MTTKRTLLFLALLSQWTMLALWPGTAGAVSPQMAHLIGKIQRDLGGAMEHTAVLRDEIEAGVMPASASSTGIDVMDIAGISDGGFGVTLANLRRAGDALSARLDELNRVFRNPADLDRSEALLIMRVELTSLLWSIDELGRLELAVDRKLALARIEENLTQLDRAIARSNDWN